MKNEIIPFIFLLLFPIFCYLFAYILSILFEIITQIDYKITSYQIKRYTKQIKK